MSQLGNAEQPLAQEGFDLMGAVFEVHRELGGGLGEELYQESLETELEMRGIPFQSKQYLETYYKGRPLKARYVPDLIVFDQIVVELKSVKQLIEEHQAQLINYMRICRMPVGYLVNFAPIGKVEWQRFILSEFARPNACNSGTVPLANN